MNNKEQEKLNKRKNILGLIIIIAISLAIWAHSYIGVVKECKQAVSYVPAKGSGGGVWDSPAEDEYFTYYRSSGLGFSTPPKFESREAAEKDCILHKKNN